MQIFNDIDREKTELFSIENLTQCFCAKLYMFVLRKYVQPYSDGKRIIDFCSLTRAFHPPRVWVFLFLSHVIISGVISEICV